MRPTPTGPPVWLLDIDGVVNALALRVPTGVWPQGAWVQRIVQTSGVDGTRSTLPILAARPVLEFIHRVYDEGLAEIRWHSTWRTAAVLDLAPTLGLPPIPISIAPEWVGGQATWWKLPAARRVVASGRRLLWTDDQVNLYLADPVSGPPLTALAAEAGTLLMSPDGDTGLTADDLRQIDEFLRAAG
jgi:hypothetical protein